MLNAKVFDELSLDVVIWEHNENNLEHRRIHQRSIYTPLQSWCCVLMVDFGDNIVSVVYLGY